MFRKRTRATDAQFDEALDRMLHRAEARNAQWDGEESMAARSLVDGLAPFRGMAVPVRGRVWQVIQERVAMRSREPWWQRLLSRGMKDGRLPVRRLAVGILITVAVLGGASPLGRQALAEGWHAAQGFISTTLVHTQQSAGGPAASKAVLVVGNSIIDVEGLIGLPEAERQAGFKARLPGALPKEAQLLGARAVFQHKGTAQEWRQVSLTYLIGDKTLSLVESQHMPQSALSDATPVRIGSQDGWLQSYSLSEEYPGYALTWEVGARSYWLAGPFPAEELIRIAASIPVD